MKIERISNIEFNVGDLVHTDNGETCRVCELKGDCCGDVCTKYPIVLIDVHTYRLVDEFANLGELVGGVTLISKFDW